MASLVDIVAKVASGEIPADAAKAILAAAFPTIDAATIATMVDSSAPG